MRKLVLFPVVYMYTVYQSSRIVSAAHTNLYLMRLYVWSTASLLQRRCTCPFDKCPLNITEGGPWECELGGSVNIW